MKFLLKIACKIGRLRLLVYPGTIDPRFFLVYLLELVNIIQLSDFQSSGILIPIGFFSPNTLTNIEKNNCVAHFSMPRGPFKIYKNKRGLQTKKCEIRYVKIYLTLAIRAISLKSSKIDIMMKIDVNINQ